MQKKTKKRNNETIKTKTKTKKRRKNPPGRGCRRRRRGNKKKMNPKAFVVGYRGRQVTKPTNGEHKKEFAVDVVDGEDNAKKRNEKPYGEGGSCRRRPLPSSSVRSHGTSRTMVVLAILVFVAQLRVLGPVLVAAVHVVVEPRESLVLSWIP